MYQTFILILFQIIGTYITIKHMNKEKMSTYININLILQIFYVACLFMPLLEEALFRSVCKQYLMDIPYSNLINGLIFGLFHLHNYPFHADKIIIIFQVISTSYLGYYVVQFDSFLYAYLVHVLYNFIIMASSYLIYYYPYNNTQPPKLELGIIEEHIRCPARTLDDHDQHFMDYKYIKRRHIDKKISESIRQFDQHKNKHNAYRIKMI